MNKREIKFRVWDKIMEDIAPLVELHSDWVAIPIMDEEGGHLEKRKIEDVELMQFTGLKDKNGKEIYEGDILRKYGQETEELTGEATGVVEDITNIEFIKDCIIAGIPIEVIGNIYQNKDLIN